MRRFLIFILGFTFVLFLQLNTFAADQHKIGLVNIQRCLDESNEGKRISSMLNEKNESFKRQLAEKRQELISLEEEIKKRSMMLSLDAQEDKRREYETKGRNYQMLVQKLSGELQKTENQAKKDFLKILQEIAQKIAQQEGYELILDMNLGVLYAPESFDITDKVIDEYNIIKP